MGLLCLLFNHKWVEKWNGTFCEECGEELKIKPQRMTKEQKEAWNDLGTGDSDPLGFHVPGYDHNKKK